MLKILRHKLVGNSFTYVAFDALNKGIPFLLLPILTRYLETREYGIVAMFSTLVGILMVFTGLSVHGAVNVNFFRLERGEFRSFVANAFIILFTSSSLVFVIVLTLGDFFSEFLELPEVWVLVAVIVAASQFITTINLILWQAEQKPKYFGWYEFCLTLFNFGMSMFLVVHQEMGWTGRLLGSSITTIAFACLSLFIIFKRGYIHLEFNSNHIKEGLKFGVPLIPHALSGWITTGLDRVIITTLVGLGATGLYSAGHQVGMIVGILVAAISRAFSPYLFEKLKDDDEVFKKTIVKVSYIYFLGIALFAVSLGLLSHKLLPLFLGLRFASSADVVIWVALGYAFNGMYLVVVQFIFYEKKTHWLSMVTVSGALIHAGLCYVLVQTYGAVGAAYATTLSYLIMFLMTWKLSAKVYKMPWFSAYR